LLTCGTFLGDFELIEELGVGGFAVVYKARQQRLEREVAVKVLLPSSADKVSNLPQRFTREIDLVKRLEHPNIVRLYDFGQTETGLLWMAMELVRGPELHDELRRCGRLSVKRTRNLGLQILSGLAEAHEMRIVHRDLKPGNIMLTRKGAQRDFVKILDFGVGKALGEDENSLIQNLTTTQGGTYGTPRYMAPEQLKNTEMGPHTDVYAVGLILYEMLIGEPAMTGTTTYEVLVKQISQPLSFPPWLDKTPFAHILRRATEKNGADRYPTALEFYDALHEIDYAHPSFADVPAVVEPEDTKSSGILRTSLVGGPSRTGNTRNQQDPGTGKTSAAPSTGPVKVPIEPEEQAVDEVSRQIDRFLTEAAEKGSANVESKHGLPVVGLLFAILLLTGLLGFLAYDLMKPINESTEEAANEKAKGQAKDSATFVVRAGVVGLAGTHIVVRRPVLLKKKLN